MRVRYVFGAVLLGGATYFALFGGEYSMLDLARIRRESTLEADRLAKVEEDVQGLAARADSLETDPATIERAARERWGLIRPDERLYRFDESLPDTTPESARDTTTSAPRLRR